MQCRKGQAEHKTGNALFEHLVLCFPQFDPQPATTAIAFCFLANDKAIPLAGNSGQKTLPGKWLGGCRDPLIVVTMSAELTDLR